jgi:hypothetical protein
MAQATALLGEETEESNRNYLKENIPLGALFISIDAS